jgi:hypothetical protein
MDEQADTPPTGWADAPIVLERFVVQRWDGSDLPVRFDRALWVESGGERGYIVGNARTHRGLFHVCFPDRRYLSTVSAYQLTATSTEARYWLRGFLTGQEPSIDEYLGRDRSEEDYNPTDEERARYITFLERCVNEGSHPRLNKRPDRALVITDAERAEIRLDPWRPWTYVGERVLVPDGAEWVEADPQPEIDGPWFTGPVCAERGYCDLTWLESGWSVCRDCGEVVDYR